MRLWHKDLIPVLPDKQLMGQWRECCCIARNIKVNGTPNHILVNKIMDYPMTHFYTYSFAVYMELRKRGFKVSLDRFVKWIDEDEIHFGERGIFEGWHNDRYFNQCYFNLQEKHDCGGISDEEWHRVNELWRG